MGLNEMDFPFYFTWHCLKSKMSYEINHLKLDAQAALHFTLRTGDVLILEYGTPKWIEFTLLLQSKNFVPPHTHGIRGIIAIYKLRRLLRTHYEGL